MFFVMNLIKIRSLGKPGKTRKAIVVGHSYRVQSGACEMSGERAITTE